MTATAIETVVCLGIQTIQLIKETGPETKPTTFVQKALVVNHERKFELRQAFETPAHLAPNEVKIRSHAVRLNQIDFKSVDYNFCLPSFPWVTDREMAGVNEDVGSAVSIFKRGERVWASTYYSDIRAGCFQELVIVPENVVTPIRVLSSGRQARGLRVRWLVIPMPVIHGAALIVPGPFKDDHILIWGVSSVTGQNMIQLAKRRNLRVIYVSSRETEKVLRSLGTDHIIPRDGKSNAEIAEQVRSTFGDRVTRAVDLVGAETSSAAVRCLSTTRPERLAPLVSFQNMSIPRNVALVNVELKQFTLDPACVVYSRHLSRLVEGALIKLPKIEVLEGGLYAVETGLKRLKAGTNGKKLVVDMKS